MNSSLTHFTIHAFLLLGAAASAVAQPAEQADLVLQAKRFYEVGKHREAADAFAAAYAASGDPALLYNVAQAARRAGDGARAASAYETYLTHVPDAPNRALIEERIAALRKSAEPPQALMTDGQRSDEPAASEVAETATPTVATPPRSVASVREGLFLRLTAGAGAHSLEFTETIYMSGVGVGLSGAVGFSLSPRWATFVELGASRVPEPSGVSYDRRTPFVLDFGTYTFGVGAAFFPWARHNLSVSLSALAMQVWYESFGDPGPEVVTGSQTLRDGLKKSNFGTGFRAVVAKEWWVRRDVSLGVGVDVAYTSTAGFSEMGNSDVRQFGLVLIAGYN